jgi:hypothetical protein
MRAPIELAAMLAIALVPMGAAAASWPEPPLPPQTDTTDVAQHIVFNGLDMRAQVFRSQQSSADVVAFYRKAWGREMVVNTMGNAQVIGRREGDYFITLQVSDVGDGSKGNVGIIDVASAPKDFVAGQGLPRPMGSKVFNDISYPDDPVPARTVAMRNGLSLQQNATWYRERLAGEGWKPADTERCGSDNCVLRYDRGDSHMTLVMTRADAGQSQVMINLQEP